MADFESVKKGLESKSSGRSGHYMMQNGMGVQRTPPLESAFPAGVTTGEIAQLQRIIGNRAVAQLLGSQSGQRVEDPTRTESGVPVNDDPALEQEASVMGEKAVQLVAASEEEEAPVQEKHLPHEAWHVVQQMEGGVTPIVPLKDGILRGIVQKAPNPARYGPGNENGPRPAFPFKDAANQANYPSNIPEMGDTTKHHVIPWNKLKAFVKAMIDNHHPEINAILQGAVDIMMAQSPLVNGTRMQGASTQASLTGEINAPIQNGFNAVDQDSIATSICWLPGNLFIGPLTNNRCDDPGEEFETNARGAVGPKRFDILEELYNDIEVFLSNPQVLSPTIVQNFTTIRDWTEPAPYNPDAWNNVYGKWYLIELW
ncbi:hypothetical protein GTO89_14785 [Heliobacterium gestii]|uniref:DUF4157 domain-containing protein n=1 Tax=Heliomicrobium gestii TaxID=2699 RepID=A0A845LDN0_HELGE|nr:hypothetical protein [Heliomicrobium gestii]MBM7868032.1 hypothetical protein [Heliomicrobium gestii]MZP44298.1 hypothetical protein [Heliomicrobium gestii]